MKTVNFSPKLRIYLPMVIGIILSVIIVSIYSVNKVKKNINTSIKQNLTSQVKTIHTMFEREYALKTEKVKTEINIVHKLFYQKKLETKTREITVTAINQITGTKHKTKIYDWKLDNVPLYGDTLFVDEINSIAGGTITIFQKIDSGYLRISTNVLNSKGERAINTYIPNNSTVIKTIEKGVKYTGRAYVVNDWYITTYEPIIKEGKIIGMLYAGDKEKDLNVLRHKISKLRIGKNGYPFVFDKNGRYVIHPHEKENNFKNNTLLKKLTSLKTSNEIILINSEDEKRITAYSYFDKFKLFIAATILIHDEEKPLIKEVIINSTIIGLLIIIIFSIFMYFVTSENIKYFLEKMEQYSKKLKTTEKALTRSEKHFRMLFNNIFDNIFVIDYHGILIECNKIVYQSLEYTYSDIIGKPVYLLFTKKTEKKIKECINKATKFDRSGCEAEMITKGKKTIPVEIKSRLIEYNGKKVILVIARDITERKNLEDNILRAIIQTEENERKRFVADLHDDLGPILSTIKLFIDLIKKKNFKNIDEGEAVKNMEELVEKAITATRTISRNIRPNILQDFGLAAAINEFCNFINKSESLQIKLDTSNYTINHRGIEETILYHAVKELINNSLKHAKAKNVKIELKNYEKQIILYYRDDGIGFDVEQAKKVNSGFGLNNIINKIKSIKGSVDINSSIGKGMFFIASINLDKSKTSWK